MNQAWYCTREDVMSAPDFKESAKNSRSIDRGIRNATKKIDDMCNRQFAPEFKTQYFGWPNLTYARPWRLWLDEHELLSVSTLTTGTVALTEGTDYFLEPVNEPPFNRVEINLGGQASFQVSDTFQRSIAITGWWGFSDDQEPAAHLVNPVDQTSTSIDIDDSSNIGVGDTLILGDERVRVTGKSSRDSTQVLGLSIASNMGATVLPVQDGGEFHIFEQILVDGERMTIIDIAGNNLIVKRAADGSVLAAHANNAKVYVQGWTLQVARAQQGTTAQSHSTPTTILRWMVPDPVNTLAVAMALDTVLQEASGYSRTIGSSAQSASGGGGNSNVRQAPGIALKQAKDDLLNSDFARGARKMAV